MRDGAQPLNALVRVRMTAGIDPDRFEAYLRDEAGIAEAWRLAGDCDFEIRLSCRSLADLAHFPFTTKADLRDTYPFGMFAVPMDQVRRIQIGRAHV